MTGLEAVPAATAWRRDVDHGWRAEVGEQADASAARGFAHHGLAVRGNGQLVSVHPGESELLLHDPDGSLVRRVPAPFVEAHGLAVVERDGEEHLWIADSGEKVRPLPDGTYALDVGNPDGRVVLVDMQGGVRQRLERPDRPEYENGTYRPTAVVVDEVRAGGQGDVWVADGYGQSLLHRFDTTGEYQQSVTGDEGGGRLDCPHGMIIDRRRGEPELYVADRRNARVQVFGLDGRFRRTVGGPLVAPCDVTVSGEHLVVAEHRVARLTVFDLQDRFVGFVGRDEAAPERPGWPNDLAADGRVVAPRPDAGLLNSPHGLATAPDGTVYVAEWLVGGRVVRIT